MIELTVKTLDSQNHSFSVPDDTTVKQLKERIAESISFPVESQRLIYCGRVLQDEKLLTEYDVNGKVIHLVQRPPPQVTRQNGNQSSARTAGGPNRRTNHGFRQPRVDANAMYLGAMAFPADLMDAQGIQAPPSSNILSTSRVSLARTMLTRASNVLNRLENPQSSQEETSETPPVEDDANNASSSTSASSTATDNATVGGNNQTLPSSLANATQAATAAAIAAAVSAAHAVGLPNITIVRGAATSGQQDNSRQTTGGATSGQQDNSRQTTGNSASDRTSSAQDNTPQDQPATSESSGTNDQPAAGASGTDDSSQSSGRETLRTTAMSELMTTMLRIHQRMSPFAQQYQRLMNEDPTFDDSAAAQESQRIFSGVSEIFHYLSHAYHAMSDIMCDFSQPPPRNLRCRPVLIQHSAVLQAGIPIQAQINVMTNRGNDRSRQTASSQTNISTTAATTNTSDTVTASTPTPANTDEQAEPAEGDVPAASLPPETTLHIEFPAAAPSQQQQQQQQEEEQQQQPPPPQQPPQGNRSTEGSNIPQPTFHITPGNVEFFMEVGPSSITIDSLEATVVTNSNGGTGGSGGTDSNGAGSFPWGAATPPEFIQNLVHALGNHMMGRMGGTQNNASSTTTAAGTVPATAAGNGGQNSQARGNTATYPTTATQTRSTSRPHVHLAPAAVQSFGSNYFDPFLPCNSHHIRSRRRGTTQSSAQQASQQQQQQQPQQASASEPDTQEAASTAASVSTQESARSSAATTSSAATSTPSAAPSTPSAATAAPSASSSARGLFSQFPGFPPDFAEFQLQVQGNSLGRFPALMPLIQSFPAFTQSTFMRALLGGAPISDVLATFPDHSYVEGESTFLDFWMVMARHLSFNDFFLLSVGAPSLTRLRPHLQEFIRQKVLRGEAATEENISAAVHRLLQELRPHLKPLAQVRVKDELDVILSVNQYNQIRLPELINIIMERESNFSREFMQWFTQYGREVAAIVQYCCVDGSQGLEEVVGVYVRNLMSGVQDDVLEWTLGTTLTHLRSFLNGQEVPVDDIQQFLVYRIPSLPQSLVQSTVPVSDVSSTELHGEEEQVAEPMETDSDTPTVNGSLTLETHSGSESEVENIQSPTNTLMDSDTLPDVVLGSEPWHNVLPSDWVPIITRDTQRQKKQNSQAPFSDAYLTGMPSKRRKIVSSTKPQGNVSQILAEGVRHAVTSAGIREVPDMETAGEDLELQAAYREQMRYSFQDNVGTSADVTHERFPNTTKYFEK